MNDIYDAACEYLGEEFSVIPVNPKTKKPLINWKKYQKQLPTEEELETWWKTWPKANVAIVTGELSGLAVIDADSLTGCNWVTDNVEKTTVYAKTSEGRFHSYFKYPDDIEIKNAVRIAPDVDIRGEGGYVVAPPSIHATGHKYEWVLTEGSWSWSGLTTYTPVKEKNKKILNTRQGDKKGNLNINLGMTKASPINVGVGKGSRNNTLARLSGQWFARDLDFEESFCLAENWNLKNNPPLSDKELLITMRSIFKTHRQSIISNPETPELKAESLEEEDGLEISKELLNPGGILQELMEYIDSNASASIPLFSLGSALSFLGAIVGQKVMTESGLRTNLYCISLGYSGSGKNGAISTLPQLISKSAACNIMGPTELTSDAAILSWLAEKGKHNSWLCLDEIGQVLRGMKSPNSPQAGIPRVLTKLFSSTDRPETKGYASQKNTITIPWHHLSLYGATTPERFWESITTSDVADGFLARILIFESLHDAPLPKHKKRFDVPKELEKKIDGLYNIDIEWATPPGNIVENMDEHQSPIPNIIPKKEDAQEYFNEFALKYHNLKNKHKKNTMGISGIYGRAAEHASKLALIHAISLQGKNLQFVEKKSCIWACGVVDHLSTRLIKQIKTNIVENDVERWKKKILAGIREFSIKNNSDTKRSYSGASLRDLQRSICQGLKTKELRELISDLYSAEIIGKRMVVAKNNRQTEVYYVASH